MTINEIENLIYSDQYNFLHENPHLGENIILLGLGGSYAYGTNIKTSDVDIRGCALNSKKDILTNQNFEQFTNEETDTTIYSFNKLISLLSNCNPNVIELLGLKPEHYLYISPIGRELLNNRKLFLSRRAINSFGGYAMSQLRRLENKSVRDMEQARTEMHILNSIKNAQNDFPVRYAQFPDDGLKLYIDKSDQEDMDTEIFMDVSLCHYPLRDYKAMWSEMNNIVKDYAKIGKRNKHAAEHGKLAKHMMHLVRLYLMAFDILESHEIITYRTVEHDFLMDIRNGKYLDNDNHPTHKFYEIMNELQARFDYAKNNTDLPENPDYKAINEFVMDVNERVVTGNI